MPQLKQKPNYKAACFRITDGYIYLMLFLFPLFTGFEGYANITFSKYVFFVSASALWLITISVCALAGAQRVWAHISAPAVAARLCAKAARRGNGTAGRRARRPDRRARGRLSNGGRCGRRVPAALIHPPQARAVCRPPVDGTGPVRSPTHPLPAPDGTKSALACRSAERDSP